MAISTFTQFLRSEKMYLQVHCCFTSAVKNSIRDGSSGRPHQLSHSYTASELREDVPSSSMLLYVRRDKKNIRNGAQDGHLDFHTAL